MVELFHGYSLRLPFRCLGQRHRQQAVFELCRYLAGVDTLRHPDNAVEAEGLFPVIGLFLALTAEREKRLLEFDFDVALAYAGQFKTNLVVVVVFVEICPWLGGCV